MPNALDKSSSPRSARRATNVSLGSEHLAEARALGINISQACERGLIETIAEVRAARWLEENRAAVESSNTWVREHGLPLAKHRMF